MFRNRKTHIYRGIAAVLLGGLLFSGNALATLQGETQAGGKSAVDARVIEAQVSGKTSQPQPADARLVEALKNKFRKGNLLLKKIESSLRSEEKEFTDARENVKHVKLRIQESREKIQTFKGQLQNIQSLISRSSRKLLAIRKQMAERRGEFLLLQEMVEKKKEEQTKLRTHYAKSIQNSFWNTAASGDGSNGSAGFEALSVLLAFGNLADYFQANTLQKFEGEETKKLLREVERSSRELLLTREHFIDTYSALEQLKTKQEAELRNLRFHQEAKKRLLSLTKGQEIIYRELLEAAKEEQGAVQKNIEHLKSNFSFVEQKLVKLREDEMAQQIFSVEDFEEALKRSPLNPSAPFKWPVSAIRGITAYFHDESYRRIMGIPHNAIDIPVPQGTSVKAAMAGVVLKVRNGDDTGYNYVLLAHRDGYLTLYGHLNEIFVKEGDTLFTGETFAKSGGIPGTRGAGWLTTGAHVHFEVFKDWKHVDPLDYLPLEFLPIEYVPEKYVPKLLEDDGKKVERVHQEKVRRHTSEASSGLPQATPLRAERV